MRVYYKKISAIEWPMTSSKSKFSVVNHDLTQNSLNDIHDDTNIDQHLDNLIHQECEIRNQSFYKTLMNYINEKKLNPVDVYKRAGIDRKLFWKIRSLPKYIPAKKTIIALALAMELSLEQTQELLNAGGYTLSNTILSDLIIEICIKEDIYDINDINLLLFKHKQNLL